MFSFWQILPSPKERNTSQNSLVKVGVVTLLKHGKDPSTSSLKAPFSFILHMQQLLKSVCLCAALWSELMIPRVYLHSWQAFYFQQIKLTNSGHKHMGQEILLGEGVARIPQILPIQMTKSVWPAYTWCSAYFCNSTGSFSFSRSVALLENCLGWRRCFTKEPGGVVDNFLSSLLTIEAVSWYRHAEYHSWFHFWFPDLLCLNL